MGQATDFFVSYSSADRAWAEWIAWQLEAEGYRVVIQAWDFRPGSDFVQQMHQVVEETQRTIAVLSSVYLTSAYGGAEWRAVLPRIRLARGGSLLPVRVGEVAPPGLLRPGFTWTWSARRQQCPRGPAEYSPGGAEQADRGAGVPRRPGGGRQRHRGGPVPGGAAAGLERPIPSNPFFTGRDQLLADGPALLRCAHPGQVEAATSVLDHIARASSSNATATRWFAGSSAASS